MFVLRRESTQADGSIDTKTRGLGDSGAQASAWNARSFILSFFFIVFFLFGSSDFLRAAPVCGNHAVLCSFGPLSGLRFPSVSLPAWFCPRLRRSILNDSARPGRQGVRACAQCTAQVWGLQPPQFNSFWICGGSCRFWLMAGKVA